VVLRIIQQLYSDRYNFTIYFYSINNKNTSKKKIHCKVIFSYTFKGKRSKLYKVQGIQTIKANNKGNKFVQQNVIN